MLSLPFLAYLHPDRRTILDTLAEPTRPLVDYIYSAVPSPPEDLSNHFVIKNQRHASFESIRRRLACARSGHIRHPQWPDPLTPIMMDQSPESPVAIVIADVTYGAKKMDDDIDRIVKRLGYGSVVYPFVLRTHRRARIVVCLGDNKKCLEVIRAVIHKVLV